MLRGHTSVKGVQLGQCGTAVYLEALGCWHQDHSHMEELVGCGLCFWDSRRVQGQKLLPHGLLPMSQKLPDLQP